MNDEIEGDGDGNQDEVLAKLQERRDARYRRRFSYKIRRIRVNDPSLTYICVRTDDVVLPLFQAMKKNTTVVQLEIFCLTLNPVGALGKNLMSNSTLQMLKLNFCSLPSLGAAALFRSFAVNKALRCVDLSRSHIFHGDHAVTALCQSLPEMTGLESLNLCCTGLSGFAVQGIFQGLQRNSVLQFLDLSDNPDIGSHIATSLIEGLPRLLGLQILSVQMTGLSAHLDQRPDLMKALAKGMTVNSKLWKIDDIVLHRVDYYETPAEKAKQRQCLQYLKEIELHKMRNGVLNGKWLTMDQRSLWPFILTRVASSKTFAMI
jgi:Ran GTPase-activating protein (RanGAP) involved in mRNA processing and transport